jgi:hypothetical protein
VINNFGVMNKKDEKTMDFLELKEQFESKLTEKFELLELQYAPYSFGSGLTAYRIKGRIVKIIYDGKDNQVELLVSANHDKYPGTSWKTIFTGHPADFIDNGISKLIR